jgi:transcription initiation factor TFIID subunit TAF12
MPSYDPRDLVLRLEIERKCNIELFKEKEKLQIAYNQLLENYTNLVKSFVIERQNRND